MNIERTTAITIRLEEWIFREKIMNRLSNFIIRKGRRINIKKKKRKEEEELEEIQRRGLIANEKK